MSAVRSDNKPLHESEAAYLRQVWDSIPKIRQEIEDSLLNRPSPQPEMDKALAHLQKAQDIFEGGIDSKFIPQALVEWGAARLIALQTILESQISTELQVEGLRTGCHILRDERQWKKGEFWVKGLWTAAILPSFEPPALLVVLHEDKRIRGAFGIATSPQTLSTSVVSIKYSLTWSDPVVQVLHESDLFDLNGGLSLDGIGYTIQVDTIAGKTIIRFANPGTSHFARLQGALFQVAEEMVNHTDTQAGRDYLAIWRKYAGIK